MLASQLVVNLPKFVSGISSRFPDLFSYISVCIYVCHCLCFCFTWTYHNPVCLCLHCLFHVVSCQLLTNKTYYIRPIIYSCFHWYNKCKNLPWNMGVMVKNKVARFFMDHGVYRHNLQSMANILVCDSAGVSSLVFTPLSRKYRRWKQILRKNMASQGHSRSHILGSLEITETRRFWAHHSRLPSLVWGTPANIRISVKLPETDVHEIHFCRW